VHLYTPRETEQAIYDEGKAFIEKMLLHKTVGIKLNKVDDNNGNLVGRIHFPHGEIAAEILKRGFAKLSTPKDSDFDAQYYRELKQAQLIGQTKRAGLWKDLDKSDLTQNKSNVNDFVGKVVEVHSGDSLTVERESDHSSLRVFLSSVKAPSINNRPAQSN
jgi:endonuclease YncB( thermonuclease family)